MIHEVVCTLIYPSPIAFPKNFVPLHGAGAEAGTIEASKVGSVKGMRTYITKIM